MLLANSFQSHLLAALVYEENNNKQTESKKGKKKKSAFQSYISNRLSQEGELSLHASRQRKTFSSF